MRGAGAGVLGTQGSLGRGRTISKPSPTLWNLYLLIRVLAQLDLRCYCPWCPELVCPSWHDAEKTGTCVSLVKQVPGLPGVTREGTTLTQAQASRNP